MNRYFNPSLILLFLFFFGCKKADLSDSSNLDNKIKIEILSGNNQFDTIGHFLKDSILLKVTKNGLSLGGLVIKVEQADCDYLASSYVMTNLNGLARFKWELNGKIGNQTARFIVYDMLQIAQDSVIAHAEGKYYNNAWQKAYCLPNLGISDICQSNSGRLFCGLLSFDVPYYSDDRGVSWQRLTTFPLANKEIRQLVARGNEIFVATRHDGIYYSSDNGTTWQNRSNGITDSREVAKLGITTSGKLLLSTHYHPLFISNNKGLNWIPITNGIDLNDRMTSFCETSNGILYMVSDDRELYKSTTSGTSWVKIHPSVSWNVQAIFIDDNDDMYFGNYNSTANIYKSTDGGNTWSLKHSSPAVPSVFLEFKDIYKVNGSYYFMIGGYGIIKTEDFSTFRRLTNMYSLEYLVGNNNAIYIPRQYFDLWYNMNP
jgi:photosystem II stability/assembly factor-like uncharacterized protein